MLQKRGPNGVRPPGSTDPIHLALLAILTIAVIALVILAISEGRL
ncbi:hypothetical protein [Rhodococcus sp. IEGM 1330]|nr:hypothetical protein [Rhodococcus sp. IEGM 1330]MDV8023540.1 hypothetical protein [Rhodococcus sp. IEGM 1330]